MLFKKLRCGMKASPPEPGRTLRLYEGLGLQGFGVRGEAAPPTSGHFLGRSSRTERRAEKPPPFWGVQVQGPSRAQSHSGARPYFPEATHASE